MPETRVNLKVETVVSRLNEVGVPLRSIDMAQENFDELIVVYTIFIKMSIKL